MADLTPIYIATAYRWGDANGHAYIVHVGLDQGAAVDAAEKEADDRGGKYGVEVMRWRGEDSEHVAYFPGCTEDNDATGPVWNPRHMLIADVGVRVVGAVDWPREGEPVPEWLREVTTRAEQMANAFAGGLARNGRRVRDLPGERMGLVDAHAVRAALGLAPEVPTAEVVERIGALVRERDEAEAAAMRAIGHLQDLRPMLGLVPEATPEQVVGHVRYLWTDYMEQHREHAKTWKRQALRIAEIERDSDDLRAERDDLVAAMAPDEAMRVHLRHCAACAGQYDGCDLGQELEERCRRGGWDVPRG